ncbi:MAG: hypothetical protein R3D69_17850 [Xanthobacteraceae bacterium]
MLALLTGFALVLLLLTGLLTTALLLLTGLLVRILIRILVLLILLVHDQLLFE